MAYQTLAAAPATPDNSAGLAAGQSKLNTYGHLNAVHVACRENSDSARAFFLCDRCKLVSHRFRFLTRYEDFCIARKEFFSLLENGTTWTRLA